MQSKESSLPELQDPRVVLSVS